MSAGAEMIHDAGQVDRVPKDDSADDQVEGRCTKRLALESAVTDFAALMEKYRPCQLVAGFAFVEADPTAIAQRRIGIPFDHKERSLDATDAQDLALQRDALTKAGCDKIFSDVASGAKAERPGLTEALGYLRDGDMLVVWKFDRLGRSLPHLIETVDDLQARGIELRSLTENIDTTTAGGKLVFAVFGALAEFERDLIRERTTAGLKAAAARGRKGGRKPVVTTDKLARAKVFIAQGLTVREAATRLRIGKTALYAALNTDD